MPRVPRPASGARASGAARARTVQSLLDLGVTLFEHAELSYGHGTTNAFDEAAWIVLSALGLPPRDLGAQLSRPVTNAQAAAVERLLRERIASRKPAAYLLHEAWLGPHRFYVDERAIVPRSFISELLLAPKGSRALPASPRRILDLCTGSGCLAILAALRYPDAVVDAADLSADALEVARRNVADYGLEARISVLRSDLFAAVHGSRYDLIVSNPPYVTSDAMRELPAEYRAEPLMALASGADGLDHARAIVDLARAHLEPRGTLVVEIGRNRAALERAFPRLTFTWPRTSAGRDYVFSIGREALPRRVRARML
jgi:ribosomal protein L3 glutamine methyltransferase